MCDLPGQDLILWGPFKKKPNLDALNERRLKNILFLVYKVKHQMVPGYLEDIVKRNDLKQEP